MPHERSPHVDIFKHWINMLDGLMLSCARRDIQVERLLSTKVLCIELNYRKSTHPNSKTYTSLAHRWPKIYQTFRCVWLLYAAQPKAQRQWKSWTQHSHKVKMWHTNFLLLTFTLKLFVKDEMKTKRNGMKWKYDSLLKINNIEIFLATSIWRHRWECKPTKSKKYF